MKIAFLNPCGVLGGAETALLGMLAGVRSEEPDWELTLIAAEEGPLLERAGKLGVETVTLPFPGHLAKVGDSGRGFLSPSSLLAVADTISYTRLLRRTLDRVAPDLVHTNGFKMHVLGALAVRGRVPVLWHIHDYVQSRAVMRRLMRACAGGCQAAMCNSKSVAADVTPLLRGGTTVKTIYNAIDLDRFHPEGERLDLDELSGMPAAPAGVVRVGLAGTFAKWKGHATFLEALSLVDRTIPLRGYVIGGPIYQTAGSQYSMAELRAQAERLGVEQQVGFTGFLPDPAKAMRALDIVVHASTRPEPFGMVIAEAMGCGRAVIASRAGGAVEIAQDSVNSLTHEPGDPRSLADQITRLAQDASLRLRLGRQGRTTVEHSFGLPRVGREVASFYREITGKAKSGLATRLPRPA